MDVPPKSGGPFSVLLLRSPFLRDERVCTCLHRRFRLGNGGGRADLDTGRCSVLGEVSQRGFLRPSYQGACRSGSLTQCPVRLIIPPLCRKVTVPRIHRPDMTPELKTSTLGAASGSSSARRRSRRLQRASAAAAATALPLRARRAVRATPQGRPLCLPAAPPHPPEAVPGAQKVRDANSRHRQEVQ